MHDAVRVVGDDDESDDIVDFVADVGRSFFVLELVRAGGVLALRSSMCMG